MRKKYLFILLAAFFSINANAAEDSTSDATMTTGSAGATISAPTNNGVVSSRIVDQYSDWAGSPSNADSLVKGLRSGSAITLQSSLETGSTTVSEVTFTPPTKTMGWGNVTKSLSLAKADLAAAGITNPTPEQIQTALTGGDIVVSQGATTQTVHMDGILTMRSQGMGWGQIAHKLDMHPDTVFKSAQAKNATIRPQDSHHVDATTEIEHQETSHIVEHHSLLSSNDHAVAGKSSHMTTAGGQAKNGSLDVKTTHANNVTHRAVTAYGTSMSSSSSYHHVQSGSSNHVQVQTVSHVTTASGGGMASSVRSGGSAGKSLGHFKN